MQRITLRVLLLIGAWLWIGVFWVWPVGDCGATCTTGWQDQASHDGYVVGAAYQPWVGAHVPKSILSALNICPSGTHYSLAYASLICMNGNDSAHCNGGAPSLYSSSLLTVHSMAHSGCPGYTCLEFRYTISCYTMGNGTCDYNCNGIWDENDPNDFPSNDWDNDGIPNANDPWPNDDTLPGATNKWRKSDYVSKTHTGTITVWTDPINGNQAMQCVGADCADLIANHWVNDEPSEYSIYLDTRQKTWAEWFPTGGGTFSDLTNNPTGGNTSGDSVAVVGAIQDLQGIEKGIKGVLDNLYSGQSTGNTSIGNKLDAAKTSSDTKLDLIKSAIDNKTITVSMTGVEGRLDTVNTKLETANTKLGEIKDNLPVVGDPAGLSNVDESGLNDGNPEVAEGVVAEKKGIVTDWLSNIYTTMWTNSPIRTVIEGSHVEVSGASSSVNCDLGDWGTLTFDLAAYESILTLLGNFLVGFAGLAGIISIFRD